MSDFIDHPPIRDGIQIVRSFNVASLPVNLLIPHYLMFSYLYYDRHVSPIPDPDYDALCKRLNEEWDQAEHRHKPLVDREALGAGTGFQLKYTNLIRGAAVHWFNTHVVIT
jgi:hypothetical protein